MPRGILRDLTFSRLVSAVWPAWEAGATCWTLPDVTVLSFSSPLLRAVLRLERGCFLSGLPSTGTALRGFTGWGLQRQTGGALRGRGAAQGKGGAAGLLVVQPLGGGCPYTAKALGQLCPAFLSTPPISYPQMTSPFTGTAEASYILLCTSTQSLPGPPFSIHLPSLLLIATFRWWWW